MTTVKSLPSSLALGRLTFFKDTTEIDLDTRERLSLRLVNAGKVQDMSAG